MRVELWPSDISDPEAVSGSSTTERARRKKRSFFRWISRIKEEKEAKLLSVDFKNKKRERALYFLFEEIHEKGRSPFVRATDWGLRPSEARTRPRKGVKRSTEWGGV